MPRRPTIRGYAALAAFADYLGPANGDWGRPDDLRGVTVRNGYANHQAVIRFIEELRTQSRRSVFLEDGKAVPLSRARFREPGDNPDLTTQEGVFGFGKAAIGLYGTRARMTAPGVIEIADGWGDSVRFGTSSTAAFAEAVWESDEWDLPAPIPSLTIPFGAVEAFGRSASVITTAVLATGSEDREAACAAITAHWEACHYSSRAPEVQWYAGPDSALSALASSRVFSAGLRKTLRDRALMHFDFEISARLGGKGSGVKDAIWRLTSASLGYDAQMAVVDRIVARRVQPAFDYMGLFADYRRLAWYRFLREQGVDLPGVVSTFCTMTANAWLIFPTCDVVFAVERPSAVEQNDAAYTLIFGDGDRLALARTGEADSRHS